MLHSDFWLQANKRIITPFVDTLQSNGVISYGLSSAGYDIRIADEYLIFSDETSCGIVDPKNFNKEGMREYKGDTCVIPSNSFALGRSVEYFDIPKDTLGVCLGKSTYARIGVIVNITPLEPGWRGHLTIEISNTTRRPCLIYSNEGIAQVLFFSIDQEVSTSYADRKGKYQDQVGITLPTVKK